jgi:DNA-directed RNA polymerase subunit RPC12/RpoP
MIFRCKWFIEYYTERENYYSCFIFHAGCTKEFEYDRPTKEIDFIYCPRCGKRIKFIELEDE